MKVLSLILIQICLTATVWGGGIRGHVSDEKGRGIPFATVYLEQPSITAVTDGQGDFSFQLPVGNYTVYATALGFGVEEKYTEVRLDTTFINFILPAPNFTNSVLAGSKTVAEKLIWAAVNEKSRVESANGADPHYVFLKAVLQTSVLGRFSGINVMDKDVGNISAGFLRTGIIFVMEKQFFEYQSESGRLFRRILAFHEAGDPQGINVQSSSISVDLHHDRIKLLGLQPDGFISPLNREYNRYYDFSFEGAIGLKQGIVERIKVIPKKSFDPLFSGYLYFSRDNNQLCGVDLYLTRNSQANGIDTLRLKQTFRKDTHGSWKPLSQVIQLRIKNLWKPVLGAVISTYSDQPVEEDIETPRTPKKIRIVYDPLALVRNKRYWDSVRTIPTNWKEQTLFHFKDSLSLAKGTKEDFEVHKVQTSLAPLSLVFGYPHVRIRHDEFGTRPFVNALQFNSVEGVSGTLELSWRHFWGNDDSRSFYIQTLNRYSQHNHHVNSLAHLGMDIFQSDWPNRSLSWQLTMGQYIYQINGNNPVVPILNEIYTLFRGLNYMKLYENQIYGIALKRDWGFGLSGGFSLSYEKRKALANGTNFSFIKNNDERISPNIPNGKSMMDFERAVIAAFSVSFQPGVDFIWYPGKMETLFPHTPKFTLDFTAGIPVGNTTADFEKWRLMMNHSLPIKNAGRLDYQLAVGGFLNTREVNLPDWNHINGYRALLATPYLNSFQLADNYRYSNIAKIYEEVHLEWHLNGLLTGDIPFIKRANIHLVFGSNAFYIGPKDFYAEGFVGFENIGWGAFRYGRIDFLTGYNVDTKEPLFGIRLGLFGLWEALLRTKTIRDL